MTIEFKHVPVLYEECMENLNIRPDGIYVDGTLGGGGHAFGIGSRLSEKGMLIGIDRDRDALAAAEKHVQIFHDVPPFLNEGIVAVVPASDMV